MEYMECHVHTNKPNANNHRGLQEHKVYVDKYNRYVIHRVT